MPATATSRLDGVTTSVAVKAPVRTVSDANLTLAGLQTVGGVTLVEGDRVLVKNQTTTSENGIYNASTGNWTRTTDFDGARDVVKGTIILAQAGVNGDAIYQVTSSDPIVPGTSAITFEVRDNPLPVPVPVNQGGTGGETAAEALENLGLIDLTNEISITADTSLDDGALGKAHVLSDSGSPVNYQVDLPDSAPVGSIILIRVAQSATKLYTIAGTDVGIDGEASRILWRNESCLLMRESANWTKISGRTIPFRGCLVRTASQSFAAGTTYVPVDFTDEVGDRYNLDLCYNSVSQRFVAPRLTSFDIKYNLCVAASVGTAAATVNVGLSNAGSSPTVQPSTLGIATFPVGGDRVIFSGGGVISVNTGDAIELMGRIADGGGGAVITSPVFEVLTTIIAPTLSYAEVPLW